MDEKRRRSSLKPVVNNKEDEITVECPMRPKRRISFSGKKLVREFFVEEEAKIWKYSYEESEQADSTGNGSGNSNNTLAKTSTLNTEEMNSKLAILTDDKENIEYREYVTQAQTFNFNLQPNASLNSVCDRPLGESGFCQLENSLAITLLEQEKCPEKPRLSMIQLNELRVSPSFSLDENEIFPWKLSAENTVDFMHELLRGNKNVNQINRLSVSEVKRGYADKNNTFVDNNLIMDNAIGVSGNNTINTTENVPKSNSICQMEDMDISLESFNKSNCIVNSNDEIGAESNMNHIKYKQHDVNAIDITSEVFPRKITEVNVVNQNEEFPMEISTLHIGKNCTSVNSKATTRKTIHYDINIPMEAEDTECMELGDMGNNVNKRKLDFEYQRNNVFDMSLSHEFCSPLFSPHYIPSGFKKNPNLRELCDAIGQGKIKVFPNVPKNSMSARKDKRKQNAIPSKDVGTNTETEIYNTSELKSCKRNLCYSLSDELLLDNTSFLAKAKLDDETISNNNSRCGTSQRRQTIHFNSKIDIEPVECNAYRDISDCPSEIEKNSHQNIYKNTPKEQQRVQLPFLTTTERESANVKNVVDDIVVDHNTIVSHNIQEQTINISKDIELDDEGEQETNLQSCAIQSMPNAGLESINYAERDSEYFNNLNNNCESEGFKLKLQDMHIHSLKIESINVKDDEFVSPTINAETRECTRKLFEGTPHRSIIEFEELEKQAVLDQQHYDKHLTVTLPTGRIIGRRESTYEPIDIMLDVSGLKPLDVERNSSQLEIASPVESSSSNKRSTINLTPNLPLSKKRQTINFKNCGIANSPFQKSLNVRKALSKVINKRHTILIPEPILIEKENVPFSESSESLENGKTPSKDADQTGSLHANMHSDIKDSSMTNHNSVNDCNTLLSESIANMENLSLQTRGTASLITGSIGNTRKSTNTFKNLQRSNAVDDSNYNCSLETIEVPRATMIQRKDSLLPEMSIVCQDKSVMDERKQQSVICVDDENPITISDVSLFYTAQNQNPCKLDKVVDSIAMEQTSVLVKNSCTTREIEEEENATEEVFLPPQPYLQDLCNETTVNNMAQFINLNCNSSSIIDKYDDIEKTRLSLVETLSEDDKDTDIVNVVHDVNMENLLFDSCVDCQSQNKDSVHDEVQTTANDANDVNVANVANDANDCVDMPLKTRVLCRRCRNISLSESDVNATGVMDSFMLPSVPFIPVLNMSRLRKLRMRPTLTDVFEFYRRVSLERSYNLNDLSTCDVDETCNVENKVKCDDLDNVKIFINNMNADLNKQKMLNRGTNLKGDADKPNTTHMSVVQRLDSILKKRTKNWIFNYQRQSSQLLIFNHRKIPTFTIEIFYKELTDFGEEITLQSTRIERNLYHNHWKPIDFVMDFQLRLELPFDLQTLCPGNDEYAIYKMLKRVDEVCLRVHELSLNLWMLVCSKEAALVEIANSVYVEKTTRSIVMSENACPYMERMEFRIELTNILKVCCKDIVKPPLHRFREDVQELSMGYEFLSKFLTDPKKYLKN